MREELDGIIIYRNPVDKMIWEGLQNPQAQDVLMFVFLVWIPLFILMVKYLAENFTWFEDHTATTLILSGITTLFTGKLIVVPIIMKVLTWI